MELIIASIVAFASTNIDDIFVLMLFFGDKTIKTKDVVIGQYLGIGGLIGISFVGSLIGLLLDKAYIGFLGFLPIFIGLKSLIKYYKSKKNLEYTEVTPTIRSGTFIFSVAGITFANGGDNIGIYTPLFSTLTLFGKLIMISIFLLLVAVWCLLGLYLSRHRTVAKAIDKYGHIVTPFVLIVLGFYILNESGSFVLLQHYITLFM